MSGSISNTPINSPSAGAVFVGFSTVGITNNLNTSLYDIDIVNQDLYFAFHTRVGERVMRPDYGCKIWDYFMEQLTPGMRDAIVTEAIRICNLDARLVAQSVEVYQLGNGIRIEIQLFYQELNVVNNFYVNFENAETAYFGSNGTQ